MENMKLEKTLQEAKEESYKFLCECLRPKNLERPPEKGRGDIQIIQALGLLLSDPGEYTLIDYGCGEAPLIEVLRTLSNETLQKITYIGVNLNYPNRAEEFVKEIKFSQKVKDIKLMTTGDFEAKDIKGKYIMVINVMHEIPLDELPKRLYHFCKSLERNGLLYIHDFIELKEGEHNFVTWDYNDFLTIFDRINFEIIGQPEWSHKSGKFSFITLAIRKLSEKLIPENDFKKRCIDMYYKKKNRLLAEIDKLHAEGTSDPLAVRRLSYLQTLNSNIDRQLRDVDKQNWLLGLEKIIPNFEIVDERIESQAKNANPEDFYKGNTSWGNIISGYDAKRSVSYVNKINLKKERWSYYKLFEYLIRKENEIKSRVFFLLLTGAAGEGKTTLLLRIGYDLYKLKVKEEMDFYVLRLCSGYKINSKQLLNFYRYVQKPIYLLIDAVSIFETVSDLWSATYELSLYNVPITIVTAARKDEWEIAKGRSSLHVNKYDEMLLEDLERGEIEQILSILEINSLLGELASLSYEERITKFFEEKAKKQLLVALMELTKGESFERILENEYANLKQMVPKAAEAYLIVCFLYQYGKLVPEGYLQRICGYGNTSRWLFFKQVINTTPKVIIREWERGLGIGLRARHPVISSTVIRKILSKEEKEQLICEIIDSINIGIRGERYIVIKLLKGIISEYLDGSKLQENKALAKRIITKMKPEIIKRIIEKACQEEIIVEILEWAWIFYSIKYWEGNIDCLDYSIEIGERNRWDLDPKVHYWHGKALNKYLEILGEDNPKGTTIGDVEKCFQKAYDGRLRWAPFLIEYAKLEEKKGKHREAAKLFEENLKLFPQNQIIKLSYSEFIKRREQDKSPEEFLNILKGANEVNPDNIRTLWKIAEVLEKLGDKKSAFEKYEYITSIKPDHEGAIWKCAYIALELKWQYSPKAINFFRTYLSIHSERDIRATMARNDLSRLLIEIGKEYYEEAEKLWLEAINISPEFPWSYIELGDFCRKVGRNKDAVEYLIKGEKKAMESNKPEAVEKARGIIEAIKQRLGTEQFALILRELLGQQL